MASKTLPGILALLLMTACSTSPVEGSETSEAAQTERAPRVVNHRCQSGLEESDGSSGKYYAVFTLRLGKGESARISTRWHFGADYRGDARIAKVVGAGVTSTPTNEGELFIEAPGDADYQVTTESLQDRVPESDEDRPHVFFQVDCYTACKTADDCTEMGGGRKAACTEQRTTTPTIGTTKYPMTCSANASCEDGLPENADCGANIECGCGLECRGTMCLPRSDDDF